MALANQGEAETDGQRRSRGGSEESGARHAVQSQEMETILKRLYDDPSSHAAYAGVQRLWEEAQKELPTIKKRDVREWLRGHRTYTLHFPQRIHFPRSRTIPAGFMTDVQADLADMQAFSRQNRGARYILVAIDVLSKQLFAVPVKNKSSKDMVHAFKELFAQMPMKPHRLFTDKGKEFENRAVKELFEEEQIEKYKPNSSMVKASLAERCIRNLRSRLHRYFSEHTTNKWVDVLPKIVEGINNSRSRAHGMIPAQIGHHNAQQVWGHMYGPADRFLRPNRYLRRQPKYHKGDFVRMSRNRGAFNKGYWPSYSDEIMIIDKVKASNPPRYKLVDEQGEPFSGYFYESDLQRVRRDENTTFRIEKRLRTRRQKDGTKEWLCKFYEDPRLYWLDESHFTT